MGAGHLMRRCAQSSLRPSMVPWQSVHSFNHARPQPPPYLGQEVHKLAGSAPALMRGAGWEPRVFACESAAVPVELWVPHAHRPWLHLCCASATLVLVLTRTSMSQVPQTAQ